MRLNQCIGLLMTLLCMIVFGPSIAHASAPYKGTITAGSVFNGSTGQDSLSTVTFDCTDPALGHYDICVDTVVRVVRTLEGSKLRQSVHFNPRITLDNKNILLRWFVSISETEGRGGRVPVLVMTENPNQWVDFYLQQGQTVTVYRETHDGGDSWDTQQISTH